VKNTDRIKTIILGVGNILLGDEGIGVHTIKKLTEEKLPHHALIVDGSTAGFRLLTIFETYKNCKFIIIDAIKISYGATDSLIFSINTKNKKTIHQKGDIYLIPLSDLYNITRSEYYTNDFISFHQTGLMDVIKLFSLTHNVKISGYLIGVNIGEKDKAGNETAFSVKLSPIIKRKIPEIIKLIKKHL